MTPKFTAFLTSLAIFTHSYWKLMHFTQPLHDVLPPGLAFTPLSLLTGCFLCLRNLRLLNHLHAFDSQISNSNSDFVFEVQTGGHNDVENYPRRSGGTGPFSVRRASLTTWSSKAESAFEGDKTYGQR